MSEATGEITLEGVAASPGVAHAQAFVLLRREVEVSSYGITADDFESETERFEQVLLQTRREIVDLQRELASKLGEDEAMIFDAHLLVLEDRALIEETIREMEESRLNIDFCFHQVADRFIEAFSHIDDPYIRERVTDIRDVAGRVLRNFSGKDDDALSRLGENRILVARDISPSDAAGIERSHVSAIVTDSGSRTSHAVIMARSLGVPAVVGMHDATEVISSGDSVLVDGYDGVVIVNPSESSLFRYGKIQRDRQSLDRIFQETAERPGTTRDGRSVPIRINIEGSEGDDMLRHSGPEGVGLFRTESLFMREDGFPGEEQQFEVYRRIAAAMAPRPVVIRTLDLGGDKLLPSSQHGREEKNPFMGFRAIRFCLENRDLFRDQLRAILRAGAHGSVRILLPMISGLQELLEARAIIDEAGEELRERNAEYDPDMAVGTMIEVPSAAATADLLAAHSDFFSIGTNDLIQYLLAVDRVNDRIAHMYEPGHPAVLRAIRDTIRAARSCEIPVSTCGEMAAEPAYALLLIGLGVDEISVTASARAEINFLLGQVTRAELEALAEQALSEAEPRRIKQMAYDFYNRIVGSLERPE